MRSSSGPGIVSSWFAGREEQHVGEVEVELEVVVAERVVLRGIEHLQQRGRGVTAPAAGLQLVDLVDQQHRVHRARFGQRADDATGPRTDVGTPVTTDLGLVAHTADGDPHERAAERARHRLTERRLADTRRTDEHEDRTRAAATRHCRGRARAAARAPRGTRGCAPSPCRGLRDPRRARRAPRRGRCARRPSLPHGSSNTASSQLRTHACSGLCCPMRSSRSSSLSIALRTVSVTSSSASLARYSATDVFVAVAELLADRVHLAAQQHLALLLVEVVADLGADLVLQLEVGEHLAGPCDRELEAAPRRRSSRAAARAAPS